MLPEIKLAGDTIASHHMKRLRENNENVANRCYDPDTQKWRWMEG